MADSETDDLPIAEEPLVLPEIGASADTWGGKLNDNFALIAAELIALHALAGGAAAKSANLSDLASAVAARTNLGLTIGADVQAHSAALQSISGLSLGAGNYIYFTGPNTAMVGTISTAGLAILEAANAGAQRTALGLGALATLGGVNNDTWFGADLAIANGGTAASNAADARTNLGLVINTDVQGYHANLAALAGLSLAADKVLATSGSSLALLSFTPAGKAMAAAADVAAQRSLLTISNVENKSSETIRGEITSANVTSALTYIPTSVTGLTGVRDVAAFKSGLSLTKSDVALGNAENKSSETIRGELTKANVDTALGKTAVRVNAGAAAGSGLISWGTGAPPTLDLGQIYLRHA